MQVGIFLLGLALMGLVAVDAFVTILSTRGGGPLTTLWTRAAWRILLFFHDRRPMHRVLGYAGPAMLALVVLVWLVLLAAGWFAVFASDSEAVIANETKTEATSLERLYFLGATISSSGYGDFVPSNFPWTFFAGLATTSVTLLVTASLSYILPVVSAAVERKILAQKIRAIGEDPVEIVERAWAGPSAGALDSHVLSLLDDINQNAHAYLVYPILHHFHVERPEESPSRMLLMLSDALFLAGHVVAEPLRPPASLLRVAEKVIQTYARLASHKLYRHAEEEHGLEGLPSGEALESRGIRVVEEPERRAVAGEYEALRRRLVALCREDGWADPSA